MPNALQAVVVATSIVIVLFLGITIVDSVAEGQDGFRGEADDTVLLNDAGTWTQIDTVEGYDETVVNSRGWAVRLTGADDSYVRSKQTIDLASDETWTIAAWGRVGQNASGDVMTLVDADGKVVIEYDGIDKQWEAWYYDESGRDSYSVTASARDQPETWQHVAVRANGTHLAIATNGTVRNSTNVTSDSIVDAPTGSGNWHGRIDELRTFDDNLSSSQLSSLHSDANAPQKGTNRTARVMFDEPDRATQRVFFAGTNMETSNATFESGLPGKTMDGVGFWNDITGATDYRWDTDGPRILATSGGELDGAPAAYVSYDRETGISKTVNAYSSFIELAAVLPVFLLIVVIIGRLREA